MMGVLLLESAERQDAPSLGLDRTETFNVVVATHSSVRGSSPRTGDGTVTELETVAPIDTPIEVEYLGNGGILHYVRPRMAFD